MSRSGVSLNDTCLEKFNELKLKKTIRYVVYHLAKNNTVIEVEKVVEKDSSPPEDAYNEFLSSLPTDECRYVVYDFEWEQAEGKRAKPIFIAWNPDTAKIKQKMVYSSSKATLKDALTGVGTEIQGTDMDEVDYDTVLSKVKRA